MFFGLRNQACYKAYACANASEHEAHPLDIGDIVQHLLWKEMNSHPTGGSTGDQK